VEDPVASGGVRLLAGGNPQVAKGDGRAPVEAYLDAVPGWKQDVCRWLDGVVTQVVPDARQAVRWNSPFYGSVDGGWFLSFHCFTRYLKVTFFDGARLDPPPPESSKDASVRYLHLREHDDLDALAPQVADWVRQAAVLPGWTS
jgi:hypothetical protein